MPLGVRKWGVGKRPVQYSKGEVACPYLLRMYNSPKGTDKLSARVPSVRQSVNSGQVEYR